MAEQITRKSILAEAEKCICTDREAQYGPPESNFAVIAELWNTYLAATDRLAITPHDVGIMLALLKIGRIASGQRKMDNYIDLAGYAACAGELACAGGVHEQQGV